VSQGYISAPLLFVTFVDVMSVLITVSNASELQTKSTSIQNYMFKWFAVNGLSLNIEKSNELHFKSDHLQNDAFQIF